MKKYYKLTRPRMGHYIQPAEGLLSALDAELDPNSPDDNSIVVSAIEMDDENYKNLPEFTGW